MIHDVATLAKIQRAETAIREGLAGKLLADYVRPAVPPGWILNSKPTVTVGSDGDHPVLFVYVSAVSPSGTIAGVKVAASVPPNLEDLGTRLHHELRQKIAERRQSDPAMPSIRFKLLADGARQPMRATEGSSGYDIVAPESVYIKPNEIRVVHAGVAIEMPEGFGAYVLPRSSMSKRGLWVQIGVIDRDYRGTIGCTIANIGRDSQRIEAGERIAQLVIQRVEHLPWEAAETLSETPRGSGGFGSTGK